MSQFQTLRTGFLHLFRSHIFKVHFQAFPAPYGCGKLYSNQLCSLRLYLKSEIFSQIAVYYINAIRISSSFKHLIQNSGTFKNHHIKIQAFSRISSTQTNPVRSTFAFMGLLLEYFQNNTTPNTTPIYWTKSPKTINTRKSLNQMLSDFSTSIFFTITISNALLSWPSFAEICISPWSICNKNNAHYSELYSGPRGAFVHIDCNTTNLDIWEMQLPEQLESHPSRQNRCRLAAPQGHRQQTQRGLRFYSDRRSTRWTEDEAVLVSESLLLRRYMRTPLHPPINKWYLELLGRVTQLLLRPCSVLCNWQ